MIRHYTARAGQFSKHEALKISQKGFFVLSSLMFAIIFVAGLLIGLFATGMIHGLGPWACGALTLVTLAFLAFEWWIWRFSDRLMDRTARRRLHLLRGGQAEAFVSLLFREHLGDRWHLFDNLKLDKTSDIDHVLIGPSGFFVISTKSQRGLYRCRGRGGEPVFNDASTDWAQDVLHQTMRLRDQLKVVEGAKQPWMQAVLALPFAHIVPAEPNASDAARRSCPAVGHVWVLNEDDLIEQIAPPKLRKTLSEADVTRWATAVEKLHRRHTPADDRKE